MATKLNLDSFAKVVEQSGLVSADKLAECVSALPPASDGSNQAESLAEALVSSEFITRWQASKLLQGRHKGFFLGKYRLLELLGKGGMSSVYLAEHSVMRRNCAIKVLPFRHVDKKAFLDRFYREAQAIAALDHANIVRAYDIDHVEDPDGGPAVHYLVMEYVHGRELQEIVDSDGPLDPGQAAGFILQAAEGLQHAHDSGFIHRDIKPGNLLVDRRGVVKVLDLGLARLFGGDDVASVTVENNQKVLGTADYLSPEQALDSHEVDPRTDIYSLGCTFYFLLTGHPPFEGGTLAQRLMAHQTREPPRISDERPETPADLVAIVERMMAKNPDDRFQTATDLATEIRQWMATHGVDPEASPGFEPTRQPGSPISQTAVTAVTTHARQEAASANQARSALDSVVSEGHSPSHIASDLVPAMAGGSESFVPDESSVASSIIQRGRPGKRRSSSKKKRGLSPQAMIAAGAGLVLLIAAGVYFSRGGTDDSASGQQSDARATLKPIITVGADGDFRSIAEALEFVQTEFKGVDWDEQEIQVLTGTYEENLEISDSVARPFPAHVNLVAKGKVFLKPSDTSRPILSVDGVKHFGFRGFRLECKSEQPAIRLTGYLVGSRFEQSLISGIQKTGLQLDAALAVQVEGSELVISRIQFEGDASDAVGIRCLPQPNLQSHIMIRDCTFFGPQESGIDLGDYVGGNTVLGCLFSGGQNGVRFSGSVPALDTVRLSNNTFHDLDRAILLDEQPTTYSKQVLLTRNAFVDCREGDLVVAAKLNRPEFDELLSRRGVSRFNWTSRGELAENEIELTKASGRREFVDWGFGSRVLGEKQFLVPLPNSALKAVGSPDGPEYGHVGARSPES